MENKTSLFSPYVTCMYTVLITPLSVVTQGLGQVICWHRRLSS